VDEGKLSLESKDIAAEKRQELLRLFPEAQTEGGNIDFDQLKRALGEIVDPGRERYGMNWPGKADCFRLIQSPSTGTLLPVREESISFDETENVIIEGDNLEVLKLLQKGYERKIKMIYIDPPYNTGNDFIYPDDFSDALANYLQYTGQLSADGKTFSTNVESDGRFHSNWLNMMYPRLYLAKNLLHDAGVIFISIGQGEISNLLTLGDMIFGESNRVGCISRLMKAGGNSGKFFSPNIEYILVYTRNADLATQFRDEMSEDLKDAVYTQVAKDGERKGERYRTMGLYQASLTLERSRNARYYITCPDGERVIPPEEKRWRVVEETYHEMLAKGDIEYLQTTTSPLLDDKGTQAHWNIYSRIWLSDREEEGRVPVDFISKFENRHSSKQLQELGIPFEFAKPSELIEHLARIMQIGKDDIILDFFAGSGSTAQAILDLKAAQRSNQKFILVQLPEPVSSDGYSTVADITKERVRRVIRKQEIEAGTKLDLRMADETKTKTGFRVFRLASSNFKVWDAHTDEGVKGVERQMELAVNHIMPDRTAEDLFFEILIKSEYPLTARVRNIDAAGISAYSVEEDSLIVCVERKVTSEAIAAIAKRSPSKVIFLDEAFSGNDQLKANAKMNFESAGVKRFETV
jgi:adenine-specific DNA-methyltransferase